MNKPTATDKTRNAGINNKIPNGVKIVTIKPDNIDFKVPTTTLRKGLPFAIIDHITPIAHAPPAQINRAIFNSL